MKDKAIFVCFLFSFFCWVIPFIVRLFFIDVPEIEAQYISQLPKNEKSDEIIQHLLNENNQEAFVEIFKNNIKGCILNIVGGITLGLGTLINVLYNGFFIAGVFVSISKSGVSLANIIKVTLPHSFELIGFWLSGGIGFYIAWQIISFIRGKKISVFMTLKKIVFNFIIIFLIILIAAYVEAYISIKQL